MLKSKDTNYANMQPPEYMLDSVDRHILNFIQTAFPIESRPYASIGRTVGISEKEAFARIKKMKELKVIRRIGANFDSTKLGFRSTLCAAKVPNDKLDLFIETVNEFPGVTHNYLRSNVYNIWFTLIAPSWDEICSVIKIITLKTGIEIMNLPKTSLYKINVNFNMD